MNSSFSLRSLDKMNGDVLFPLLCFFRSAYLGIYFMTLQKILCANIYHLKISSFNFGVRIANNCNFLVLIVFSELFQGISYCN